MQYPSQRVLEAYDPLKARVNPKQRLAKAVPKQIDEGSGASMHPSRLLIRNEMRSSSCH